LPVHAAGSPTGLIVSKRAVRDAQGTEIEDTAAIAFAEPDGVCTPKGPVIAEGTAHDLQSPGVSNAATFSDRIVGAVIYAQGGGSTGCANGLIVGKATVVGGGAGADLIP